MTEGVASLRLRWTGSCESLSADDRRALLDRAASADMLIRETTATIIAQVRSGGDAALRSLALQFDGVALDELEVPRARWTRALDTVAPAVRRAMERSATNVRRVHAAFMPTRQETESEPGIVVGRRPDPLGRVGVYAPGGRASYPRSVPNPLCPP